MTCALVVAGCSMLTSLDDLGPPSATLDGGGGNNDASVDVAKPIPDVPIPQTCKSGNVRCVAAAPAGWSPPFALYAGAVTGAPSCPADAPIAAVDAYNGLTGVSPAVCGACTCVASKVGCAKVTGVSYQNANCTGGCNGLSSSVSMSDGACVNFDCTNGLEGSIYVPLPTVSATCTPQAPKPTVTKPPTTWTGRALGCRAPTLAQVDCASGEVCATKAPAPFDTKMCIAQDGNVACPAGPYSVKKGPYAQGTSDTRDCSACACGTATGNCTATVTPYSAPVNQCMTAVAAPQNLPGCIARGTSDKYLMQATPPPNVNCPASGGAPTGTVVSSGIVTVCCEP